MKHPRLYWTPEPDEWDDILRIIYPHGPPECVVYVHSACPCWYREGMTPAQQIRALKKYCRDNKQELIFLGDIK